jgi:hypothetical protein
MFARLASAVLLRRILRDLDAIGTALSAQTAALDRQTAVLTRLADHLAPLAPPADRVTVSAETGVTHLDATEAALALAYIERTRQDTGHVPDDDEVLIYLADEKTHDLHQRLVARDAELDRLRESRQW